MPPIWMRATHRQVEIAIVICFLGLQALLLRESIELGPGWGETGPAPGFFPFSLTCLMIIGTLGVLFNDVYRRPDRRPFFEVSQEVVDLLRVGIPILAVVYLIEWLGLYISSGLYIGFFMAWYGRFRWDHALIGAILMPVILWLTLRYGFNLSMPMSVFYRQGMLPV